MRKFGIAAMLGLALVAGACAQEEAEEGIPADTATMAPAPAPAPAPLDTTMMDTTMDTMTTTTPYARSFFVAL
ncbi:MAG: hypothetical protein ACT4O1_12920 [Gemmatimonadota bacterium]